MSDVPAHSESSQAAFDLKAGQFLIPTLVLRDLDIDALGNFLSTQVARMPAFFDQAPVVIDLSSLSARGHLDEFPTVVGMLRGHGMNPVGVRGASADQQVQAQALEVAVMPNLRRSSTKHAKGAESAPQPTAKSLVIDRPVRSGQSVFAETGDLVLLAGVSSGAEVMADGHIHAYGPLRGRALAGVTGDTGARIFCHELGAELISIAGRYRVSDDLEDRYLGRSVHISLRGDTLDFNPL